MSERNASTLYLLIFSTDEIFLIKDAFLIQVSIKAKYELNVVSN